ncbi:sigma-54 interaction domain-containing protein [Cytobacillus kochii]|uniref:sigma-54 interaction domain-containing protein n=1 Tax=Cytobacillus kochii TaxID=859143 RepID=UPI00203D2F74|nr:sigma 54-interacting transcriptional regulator [Cytobacillus kochii]MCM3323559.1 sigma 54-interacting transcriptional regulator [Cytobacillus kochii]MCM3345954.1 sigma 54-interacting transcriptional regulator [Cytobacillus kochii]
MKHLENLLKDRPEFLFRKIIGSSFDGVTITNAKGQTIWYNQSFLQMSGLLPSQLDNYTAEELIKNGWMEDSASIEAISKGVTITKSVKYSTGVEALISATPILDNNGSLMYTFQNIRDITELNKLKHQLDETYALSESYRQTLQEVQQTSGNQIIYQSTLMENIIILAQKFSKVNTPILILGESGSGKDVLANYIHNIDTRANSGPFVKINCGAIPEQLLESELFGYEAGAFSGANRNGKAGLFEVANSGTIFLDEIGEMPLSLQVKLLGVLQDMKIQRIGGTKEIPIDVRVIAATNADLEKMIREKKFRQDLYFRLNVLSITIPPLRERPDDIIVLIEHFLKMFNEKHQFNKSFSPSSIKFFLSYDWPGNIRELKNLVERLMIVSDGNVVNETFIPANIRNKINHTDDNLLEDSIVENPDVHLKSLMDDYEKKVLSHYLAKYRPMRRCADVLGIDLTTLARKKKRYGL